MKRGDIVHLDRPGCPWHEQNARIVSIDGPLSVSHTTLIVQVRGDFGLIEIPVRRFQVRPIYDPEKHTDVRAGAS